MHFFKWVYAFFVSFALASSPSYAMTCANVWDQPELSNDALGAKASEIILSLKYLESDVAEHKYAEYALFRGRENTVADVFKALHRKCEALRGQIAKLENRRERLVLTTVLEEFRGEVNTIGNTINSIQKGATKDPQSDDFLTRQMRKRFDGLLAHLDAVEQKATLRTAPSIPSEANASLDDMVEFIDDNNIETVRFVSGGKGIDASVSQLLTNNAQAEKTVSVSFDALNGPLDYSFAKAETNTESFEEHANYSNGSFWKYFGYASAEPTKATFSNQLLQGLLVQSTNPAQSKRHVNLTNDATANALFRAYRFSDEKDYNRISRRTAEDNALAKMKARPDFVTVENGLANAQTSLTDFATVTSNDYVSDLIAMASRPSVKALEVNIFEGHQYDIARTLVDILTRAQGASILDKLKINLFAQPRGIDMLALYDYDHGVTGLLLNLFLLKRIYGYQGVEINAAILDEKGKADSDLTSDLSSLPVFIPLMTRLARLKNTPAGFKELYNFVDAWEQAMLWRVMTSAVQRLQAQVEMPPEVAKALEIALLDRKLLADQSIIDVDSFLLAYNRRHTNLPYDQDLNPDANQFLFILFKGTRDKTLNWRLTLGREMTQARESLKTMITRLTGES